VPASAECRAVRVDRSVSVRRGSVLQDVVKHAVHQSVDARIAVAVQPVAARRASVLPDALRAVVLVTSDVRRLSLCRPDKDGHLILVVYIDVN